MKYLYYALLLSGLAILLIRRRQVDKPLLLFIPLLASATLVEISFDITHEYFIYHIYQGIEFPILCAYYYLVHRHNPLRKFIPIIIIAFFGYFTILYIRAPYLFFAYDNLPFVVEDAIVTIFSVYYLIDLYRKDEHVAIAAHPHFWISSGNLLFYSGSLLFMGLASYLMTHDKVWYAEVSKIGQLLNLILYIIYIKAFLCRSRKKIMA